MSPPTTAKAGAPNPGSTELNTITKTQAAAKPLRRPQCTASTYPRSFREWSRLMAEKPYGPGWTP